VRILDRHVLREFLVFASIGEVAFVGIYVIVNLFEKIDVFVDNKTPLPLVVRYYLLGVPLFAVQVLPLSLLLGSLLSLGQLRKWGELTAMQIAGWAPARILAPLLVAGLLFSAASLAVAEWVTPETVRKQQELFDTEIRGRREGGRGSQSEVILLGRGGRIYLAHSYDAGSRTMRTISVQHPRPGSQELDWRLDAERGQWTDEHWMFREGFFRRFVDDREIGTSFRRFADSRLEERPEDFARPPGDPLYMSRGDLLYYIRRLREGGGRIHKYEVDYHIRGSFPFSNLVMVLLGGILSLRIRKGGNIALAVGMTLALGFAYLAFIRVGQALGYHETLPPLLAAWLGNLTFGTLGAVMLWRAHS